MNRRARFPNPGFQQKFKATLTVSQIFGKPAVISKVNPTPPIATIAIDVSVN